MDGVRLSNHDVVIEVRAAFRCHGAGLTTAGMFVTNPGVNMFPFGTPVR